MTSDIPFIDLSAQYEVVGDSIRRRIAEILERGSFVMGPEVAELEKGLSAHCGVRNVVCCSNGTDAIVLALRALEIGHGDGVVVPAFTFAATAGAVALTGATPIFADCHADTFDLDVGQLEDAVDAAEAAGLRPAAVLPVDLFGHPADHTALATEAARLGLDVVVDGAQSYGATWHGRRTGGFGRMTTTSFFPAKPLGCYGDGGAVFTDDDDLASLLRSLRVHGQGANKYENVRIGMNARLDTIQAAVLLEKLAIYDDEFERRQTVAGRYSSQLGDVVRTPAVRPGARSAWAQYTLQLERRDEVAARLKASGVPTAIYYPTPLHRQPAFAGRGARDTLSVSDRLAGTVLSLPMHPYLDGWTQERIVQALRDAMAEED